MRLIIRTIILVAILWIGVLLSGYGVLFHSEENVGGNILFLFHYSFLSAISSLLHAVNKVILAAFIVG